MLLSRIAIGIALLAGAGQAQDQISPDAFLKRADGKTLTFFTFHTEEVIGVEQFLSQKLSVWAQSNGRCSYGHIEIRGPLVCFLYENFPDPDNCWMPFDENGKLLVMSTKNYEIQRIQNVTDDPVRCEGTPLS